jgi:hypothetical protein
MAWQLLAAALPAVAKTVGTAINKPRQEDFKPKTDYMKKYLSYIRGRTAGREAVHQAMQPALRTAGQQGRQQQQQISYDVAKSGLAGSGIEAQMRLSAGQQTQEALAQATQQAVSAQAADVARVSEQAADITAKIGAEETRAEQAYDTATSQWKRQLVGDLVGVGASVASAGLQQYGQGQAAYKQAVASGDPKFANISYDEFKGMAKGGALRGAEDLGFSPTTVENLSLSEYAQLSGARREQISNLRLAEKYMGGAEGVKQMIESGMTPETVMKEASNVQARTLKLLGTADISAIEDALGTTGTSPIDSIIDVDTGDGVDIPEVKTPTEDLNGDLKDIKNLPIASSGEKMTSAEAKINVEKPVITPGAEVKPEAGAVTSELESTGGVVTISNIRSGSAYENKDGKRLTVKGIEKGKVMYTWIDKYGNLKEGSMLTNKWIHHQFRELKKKDEIGTSTIKNVVEETQVPQPDKEIQASTIRQDKIDKSLSISNRFGNSNNYFNRTLKGENREAADQEFLSWFRRDETYKKHKDYFLTQEDLDEAIRSFEDDIKRIEGLKSHRLGLKKRDIKKIEAKIDRLKAYDPKENAAEWKKKEDLLKRIESHAYQAERQNSVSDKDWLANEMKRYDRYLKATENNPTKTAKIRSYDEFRETGKPDISKRVKMKRIKEIPEYWDFINKYMEWGDYTHD